MKAVIMAGGMGTRLQPLTRRLPKPMVPLLDRPVMEYIVELLIDHNIRDIAMTLGYLPDQIRNHFGSGNAFNARFSYVEETHPLGTAGGVKNVAEFLDRAFIVMSGDGLTDFDLTAAVMAHRRSGALATLILTEVSSPEGYGVVDLNERGYVQRFIEKPKTWTPGRRYVINTGIYIMEPFILEYIPTGTPYDFGKDLFPSLLDMGIPLNGYVAQGYWSDIGTLRQYYQTQIDMIEGRVNVRLPLEIRGNVRTMA